MEPPNKITLTDAQLRDVVHQTVQETLTALGMDVKQPLTMQQDFSFLRAMRTGSAGVRRVVTTSVIGGIVTFVGTMLYMAWYSAFHDKPPGSD